MRDPRLENISLHHCSFMDLEISEPVAAVITDPPYVKSWLTEWDNLGRFCDEVLRPGGVLASYTGVYWLPKVLADLGRHLVYRHVIAIRLAKSQKRWLEKTNVCSAWRAVMLYTSKSSTPWKNGKWIKDVFDGGDRSKKWHRWGQSLCESLYLVERLTKPGDLVCDPCMGGGTVAQACRLLGRRFVGCDVDEDCVDTVRHRLESGVE